MPTAPVLAVLVCHNGQLRLPDTLDALRESTLRPVMVTAVDTGSTDATGSILDAELDDPDGVVDQIVTLDDQANVAEAVDAAVEAARVEERWIWVLHDDTAPAPDCLAALLNAADASPSVGVVGPVAVDRSDPEKVLSAGLSTDSSGTRFTGAGIGRGRGTLTEQTSEVLAMPSAGMMIRRSAFDELGGLDPELGQAADLDLGWRLNNTGSTALCVPRARLLTDDIVAGQDRVRGVRTYLANSSLTTFVLGIPRLFVMCLLRGIMLLLTGRAARAKAEFGAAFSVLGGEVGTARRRRSRERKRAGDRGGTQGLFVSSAPRRRRGEGLGRLSAPGTPAVWTPEEDMRAAAINRAREASSAASAKVTAADAKAAESTAADEKSPDEKAADEQVAGVEPAVVGPEVIPKRVRPRPRPAADATEETAVFFTDDSERNRVLAWLTSPAVVLTVVLTALAVAVNWHRFSGNLTGGRLLPAAGLLQTWDAYLASWHPVGGGTSSNAPAADAVLGVLGIPLWPFGGPPAAIALLIFGDIPLAGLAAYFATRKLRVRPWARALAAAGYALIPAAAQAVAQGRLDVVVVHIVLPLVIAGLVRVLRPEGLGRKRGTGERWLSRSVLASFGLAVVGAFNPLTHLALLAAVLIGFIVMPSTVALGRRIASLATIVLLPLALLLPWPVTVAVHPELLLHGIGARVPAVDPSKLDTVLLNPGGAGGLPVGLVLAFAALIAVVLRPRRTVFLGVVTAAAGVGCVVLLRRFVAAPAIGGQPQHGWTGAPMVLVSAGLIMIVLAAVHERRPKRTPVLRARLAFGAGIGGVVVLALAVVAGSAEGVAGSLVPSGLAQPAALQPAQRHAMTAPMIAELEKGGRSVLVLNDRDEPPQISGQDLPHFGDDDLPLPAGSAERLRTWQQALLNGANGPNVVRDTVASASAAGVLFVVLPDGADPEPILRAGGEVMSPAAPLTDGRQVIRLKPRVGQVTLISPELSKRAVGGQAPTGDIEGEGLSVVGDSLPDVRVRVSDGPGGRLLVLASTLEDGWRATVDGAPKPIVPAWGHQVAVEVPTRAADVVVDYPNPVRTMLLLGQVAAVLFTVLTAIPAARRPD